MWFGKWCPPFTHIGQRGRTLYFKIKPFILGSLHSFFLNFNDGQISSLHQKKKKKKKNLGGISSNE
jgi:hypothetical protein